MKQSQRDIDVLCIIMAAVFNFKKRPTFQQKKAKKGQILLKYIPLENSPDLLQFKNTLDKKSNKISR